MIVRRRRPPAPFWFEVLVGLVVALLCRALTPASADPLAPSLAFWGIFIEIASLVWEGIHTVADATVTALVFAVQSLWRFATAIYDGARHVADAIRVGLYKAWDFTKGLYEDILKPAWQKFWSLVDRVHALLDRVTAPIIKFLRTVREEVLAFYAHWVRPWLDMIDSARKVLRVLSALHLDFARKLDAKLGQIEAWVDLPFQLLIGKINDVLNFVNRIATADGLFQRLALVRSIARDFKVIGDEYARLHKQPATDAELADLRKRLVESDDPKVVGQELGALYRGEDSHVAALARELAPDWRAAAGVELN